PVRMRVHSRYALLLTSLSIPSDGRFLAALEPPDLGQNIRLFDIAKGTAAGIAKVPKEIEHGLFGMDVTREGKHIIGCGGDRVLVWDVATLHLLRSSPTFVEPHYESTESPDGRYIAMSDRSPHPAWTLIESATGRVVHEHPYAGERFSHSQSQVWLSN